MTYVLDTLPNTFFVSKITHQLSGSLVQLVLALATFLVLFILVYRTLSGGFLRSALPVTALVASFAATVIVVVFLNSILGQNSIWHFGPQVQAIFGATYGLYWILVSYLALALI